MSNEDIIANYDTIMARAIIHIAFYHFYYSNAGFLTKYPCDSYDELLYHHVGTPSCMTEPYDACVFDAVKGYFVEGKTFKRCMTYTGEDNFC